MRLDEDIRNYYPTSKIGMFSDVFRIIMVTDVKPGPTIKPARLHAADVIRRQVFAQIIPLVRAHPKLVCSRTKGDPYGVANSPRLNLLASPVRVKLENAGPIRVGPVIGIVRARANRDIHL